MKTAAALRLDYISADQLDSQSSAWWQGVLGVVGFDEPPRIDPARVPVTDGAHVTNLAQGLDNGPELPIIGLIIDHLKQALPDRKVRAKQAA